MHVDLHCNLPDDPVFINGALGYIKGYLSKNNIDTRSIYWNLFPDELYNKYYNLIKKHYEDLNFTKIDSVNLSGILNYVSKEMVTNIENNIKMRFFDYVKQFVNSSFRKEHNEIIENAEKRIERKLFYDTSL